jgi:acetoin utilization deacetylase AcuC-like enzyme
MLNSPKTRTASDLLKLFYTDQFTIPLPQNHTFPIHKYALLRKRLLDSGVVKTENFHIPHAATREEITRVHEPQYFRRLQEGELTPKEIRPVGLPWSQEFVARARRSAGATIEACRHAMADGVAVNLGGGTHHAFADRGQGYCLLNDAAIASRALQADDMAGKILIIDCDVHQGNGTAVIFKDDPSVFTFSIHGKKNFPYVKEKSDLDIALDDETGDSAYLDALEKGLEQSLTRSHAEIAIYLAGADPYKDDRFGRLALSKKGLAERDRMVFNRCHDAGLPIAVTMAGGYARQVQDTVDIHYQTILAVVEFQQKFRKVFRVD